MKKQLLFLAGFAAIFASCTREANVTPEVKTPQHIRIQASVPETRTSLSIDGTTGTYSWDIDEVISVLEKESSDPHDFSVVDPINGYFEGDATNDLIGAVSPALALGAYEHDGTDLEYMLSLSGDYDYADGTNAVMVAGAPTEYDGPEGPVQKFTFNHAAGLVMVTYENLPLGTKGVRFTTNKPITGMWVFNSFDNVVLDEPATGETTAFVMFENAIGNEDLNQTFSFYIPVPVNSYTGIEIALVDATKQDIDGTKKKMSSKQFSVALGDIVKFPTITLTPAPVEQYYVKVTSLDQIADGAQYVIGAWHNDGEGNAFYAIPTNPTLNNGKITGETVSVGANGIAIADAAGFEWTLSNDGNFWTLFDGTKYLYHSSGGNSGTNLGYGATASFTWDISEWNDSANGLFKFAGVNSGTVKDRGLLFSAANGNVFGGYSLGNAGANYPGIDLYVLAGEDERTDVTLSFENASYELSIGTEGYANFVAQVVTTTPAGVTGVKYALTGAAIGSIDENTGAITLDGTTVGEATITASFAGNTTYKPATPVSYTITVDDPRCVTLDWTYPESGNATLDGLNETPGVTTSGLGTYAEGQAPYLIKMDGTGDYIVIKTDVAIGEVSVGYKMIGGNATSTLNILESGDGETFTSVEDLTIAGAQNDADVVTTTNAFASSSRYVKINFTKGSNIGIGSISIKKVDTTPRFTVESPLEAAAAGGDYTVNITRKYFTGAITVTVPTGCDWIVPGNVAANANSFSVHVNANTGSSRTATLTLSADGVTSQELVVNQAGVQPGTEANPYTVAQALAFIETLGDATSSTVWVTGTVSKVETFYSNYKSITYFISDDGTNTNTLEVYSGKGLNGANFTDITDLAVGDKLVVKGTLQKYKDTPEFTSSSIITSIISLATRYTVTLGSVTPANSGTIAASATSVGAQGVVTLTATPASGYEFDEWTVTNLTTNQTITVSEDNRFIMPAANVSVSATFTESQGGEPIELSFDLSSNPGGWPTTTSTTLTNYTYTLDDVEYTFGLKNIKCNNGYLMCNNIAALGLPAIEGYKLTKVVANNSGGCSTSTKVGVSSSASSASYISGGAEQTWSTTGSSYTYNLSGTSADTVYYLYVTNKNAQITGLTLTYTPAN